MCRHRAQVAQKHEAVPHHEIELAIAIEIGNVDTGRERYGCVGRDPGKRTVRISEHDRDAVGAVVRDHHVGLGIAVEVANGDRLRPSSGVGVLHCLKRAVAIAQHSANKRSEARGGVSEYDESYCRRHRDRRRQCRFVPRRSERAPEP